MHRVYTLTWVPTEDRGNQKETAASPGARICRPGSIQATLGAPTSGRPRRKRPVHGSSINPGAFADRFWGLAPPGPPGGGKPTGGRRSQAATWYLPDCTVTADAMAGPSPFTGWRNWRSTSTAPSTLPCRLPAATTSNILWLPQWGAVRCGCRIGAGQRPVLRRRNTAAKRRTGFKIRWASSRYSFNRWSSDPCRPP